MKIKVNCRSVDGILSISMLALAILSQIKVERGSHADEDASIKGDVHQVQRTLHNGTKVQFNKSSNFLFIGGVPKSGTTLMRVLLDVHPSVDCGPETHIFIDVLKLRYEWTNFPHLKERHSSAGVTSEMIDKAVSAFLLEVTANHGEPSILPCIKEPFLMTQAGFLARLFPGSKLIHMVRDGRAVSNSLVSRNLDFPPFSPTDHSVNMKSWAKLATGMDWLCKELGPNRCRTIRYEDLVEDTEKIMRSITDWLGLPWDNTIMRHNEEMSQIRVSTMETSTDQIYKPIYKTALHAWKASFPKDIADEHSMFGPALSHFGYPLTLD